MKHKVKTIETFIYNSDERIEYIKVFDNCVSVKAVVPEADIIFCDGPKYNAIIDNRDKTHQIIYRINL